jgi:endonuclease/exonuclease/phosphatase family metal-dependent hydrolase
MTRNVYVGTTTDAIMMASDPEEIPLLATDAFQLLHATNFPERAFALAREIKMTKPALIGLQEISKVRTEIPGDFFSNPIPDAEDVAYDYLEILLYALESYNLKYTVAGVVENFDVEVPMVVGKDENSKPLFGDIRLTDYDVVLVRKGVSVENVIAQNYQYNLSIEDLGLEVLRGYVALDARVGKKEVRFVNTHLEALTGDPDLDPIITEIQLAQAMELVGSLQGEQKPVIMVGDFNSPAPFGDTYQYILSEQFHDAWNSNKIRCNEDGFTFGHDADLQNQYAEFYERIDFVFTKLPGDNIAPRTRAIVVGDEYRNRTSSGLWPSDHGGVVANLKLPIFQKPVAGCLDQPGILRQSER